VLATDTTWMVDASCIDGTDLFFAADRFWDRYAIETCGRCPVRDACRAYVETIPPPQRHGIWAGLDQDQVRRLPFRRRPGT
jgi:hypothetical protein